jgi:hypothetical protein
MAKQRAKAPAAAEAETTRGGAKVAIGISAHTGWAAAVAVTGTVAAPVIVDKRRIELVDHSTPHATGFVYHLAAERPLAAARRLVAGTRAAAVRRARAELAAWAERHATVLVVATAIVAGKQPPLDLELDEVLASHARIHAAEGQLWREVWAEASLALGIAVERIPAPELAARVGARLSLTPAKVDARLAELGRRAGRPWAADQRLATLAAWARLPG